MYSANLSFHYQTYFPYIVQCIAREFLRNGDLFTILTYTPLMGVPILLTFTGLMILMYKLCNFQEISALGTDDWYDILSVTSKGKPRAIGKCHLKMGLCYKQVCHEPFINVCKNRPFFHYEYSFQYKCVYLISVCMVKITC